MNEKRPQPYIGISGVVGESEPGSTYMQYWLMDQFVWQGLDSEPEDRLIALGVKAVHKTQYRDIENKYGREWYPVGEAEFAGALDDGGIAALRVAQTYFDPENVDNPEYRQEFVERICKRGAAWLNAIQLDMLPWHTDASILPFIEWVKQTTGHKVLLQAHGESMQQLGPYKLAKKLSRYAHVLDYVLFDASHGKGVRMDPGALKPFLDAGFSTSELDGVGFSVAGGLNAEVVREDLSVLLVDYPSLSWDAEGQLHSVAPDGTRPFDARAAKQYLEASADILKTVRDV